MTDQIPMNRPPKTLGMRHVALWVDDLDACEYFYIELLGMVIEWRPDVDNVYLSSGNDNLALHRATAGHPIGDGSADHLDHIGFFLDSMASVDLWYDFLKAAGVSASSEPRTHRDGARSFYCKDPAGVTVQMIYHPPILGQ